MTKIWDDARAIADLKQGGQAGGRWLFAQYSPRLLNFLMSPKYFGLSHADAEEVLQEAFFRAFKSIARFDPEKSAFATWLGTIAANEAKKHWNATAKRASEPLPDDEIADDAPDLDTRLCYYFCVTQGLARFEAKASADCVRALTLRSCLVKHFAVKSSPFWRAKKWAIQVI